MEKNWTHDVPVKFDYSHREKLYGAVFEPYKSGLYELEVTLLHLYEDGKLSRVPLYGSPISIRTKPNSTFSPNCAVCLTNHDVFTCSNTSAPCTLSTHYSFLGEYILLLLLLL